MDLEVEKFLRKGAIDEVKPCKNHFLSNIFKIPKKASGRHEGPEQFHTYHGSNPRAMYGAYTADMAVVDRFRFSGRPKEVSFNTQTTIPHEFHRNETIFNGRKTVKI